MQREKVHFPIDLQFFISVIWKRAIMITGLVVLSLSVSLVNYFVQKPVYQSSFLVKPILLTTSETAWLLNTFNTLIKDKDTQTLFDAYEIEKADELCKKVDGVFISPIRSDGNTVEIFIKTYDKEFLPDAQVAVLQYLNNNFYLYQKIAREKETLSEIQEILSDEIYKLGEVQKHFAEMINGRDNIGNFLSYPSSIHQDIVSLKQRKIDITNELEELEGFETISNMLIPSKPQSPNLTLSLTVALVLSTVIGSFLAFFLEYYSF